MIRPFIPATGLVVGAATGAVASSALLDAVGMEPGLGRVAVSAVLGLGAGLLARGAVEDALLASVELVEGPGDVLQVVPGVVY